MLTLNSSTSILTSIEKKHSLSTIFVLFYFLFTFVLLFKNISSFKKFVPLLYAQVKY